jgi:UDP-3-O-[3-hydroxymyristoyl] glucosamine N-acyltransferase
MQLENARNVAELAGLLQSEFIGNGADMVTGLNEIHKVRLGDLTFADHPKYVRKALQSEAACIIVKQADSTDKALILAEDPFKAYNQLVEYFVKAQYSDLPEPVIGKNTILGAGVIIEKGVTIGERCHIGPNVVIHERTIIGNDVVIKANTVIGGDAFYFKKYEDGYKRMTSCGRVIIEDRVHIGANCTIDRGVSGDTIIGYGSKLDSMIMIGHGVEIGKHCVLAAQCGIAGKTILEDNVILWGQVGISKCLRIGAGAIIQAQSGVYKDLEGGKAYLGSPAVDARTFWKEVAKSRRSED